MSHGRLVALSSPFGQRGFFYEEWTPSGDAWQRASIPWQKCPRITPALIDQERRSLGDSWVRQEYECSFEAMSGLVYPDFERLCAVDMEGPELGRLVGGIDFGFRNPFAAPWDHIHDDVLYIKRAPRTPSAAFVAFRPARHLP